MHESTKSSKSQSGTRCVANNFRKRLFSFFLVYLTSNGAQLSPFDRIEDVDAGLTRAAAAVATVRRPRRDGAAGHATLR